MSLGRRTQKGWGSANPPSAYLASIVRQLHNRRGCRNERCDTHLVNHEPKGFIWLRVFDQTLHSTDKCETLISVVGGRRLVEEGKTLEFFVLGRDDDPAKERTVVGLNRLRVKST